MSKNDARIAQAQREAEEKEASVAMMNANHGEKIAAARERQAQEIAQDGAARLKAASDTSNPANLALLATPAKDRSNTPAIYEERIWRSLVAGRDTVGSKINQLEQEGFSLVNVVAGGTGAYIVIGARKMVYALPEEPEVPPASEETTSENAPDATTNEDVEARRKQWIAADETSDTPTEAVATTEDITSV